VYENEEEPLNVMDRLSCKKASETFNTLIKGLEFLGINEKLISFIRTVMGCWNETEQ
jgi:hypothetical protein